MAPSSLVPSSSVAGPSPQAETGTGSSVGSSAGFSLRTPVVTGAVAGLLVAMYVIDLIGRLATGLSDLRYLSVFKYYGNAIEDGIEPLAFLGVTLAACALAAVGAWLFERRDLAA